MRSKYRLIGIVMGVLLSSAAIVLAGNPNPSNPPASTESYTLEDIYNRLNAGTAGTQSTFTEPATAPGTGTMHTLNDIMAKAPALDNTNGATSGYVLNGKTAWGLTSDQWAVFTGTMPNNGAVTVVPTTTDQSIAAGYHNGSGVVQGDADLVAGNIKQGVNLFGVVGTLTGGGTYNAGVPKTGQTTPYATGDDGDLEEGVAWPDPRFTDNLNGTVTDNLTGLVWFKNANCFGSQTWANALSSANTLNSGECGLSDGSVEGDWRLPNVQEMQSLIDYGRYYPALPSGHPFTGVQSDYYWTSTTLVDDASYAQIVYLRYGGVLTEVKTYTYYVWPVRGGE